MFLELRSVWDVKKLPRLLLAEIYLLLLFLAAAILKSAILKSVILKSGLNQYKLYLCWLSMTTAEQYCLLLERIVLQIWHAGW